MNTAEMRSREDFDAVLFGTLQVAWSREQGQPVAVGADGPGQPWRFHPLHSAYTVAGASAAPRRFLANSVRYAMRRWRRPAQWVAGTALSTSPGLWALSRPGFVVSPGIPGARDMVLLPGNQRIRLFDFSAGRTRVYAKAGFPHELMSREIALRTGAAGPYPPILDHDASMTWFEEPILEGWSLARCPRAIDPTRPLRAAFESLDAWSEAGANEVDTTTHVQGVVARIQQGLETLEARFGHAASGWERWLAALSTRAGEGALQVAPTHGDCQHGNVMIQPDGRVIFIDWEHQNLRWRHYDRMVFGLKSRYPAGLPERLHAYLAGDDLAWHPPQASDRAWRTVALARFLLEEALFYVAEAAAGPYLGVTRGLATFEALLGGLGWEGEGAWPR